MLHRHSKPPIAVFISHVDWRWIKQRQHFLAESADSTYRVVVFFKPARGRRKLPRNSSMVSRLPLLPVPHAAHHGLPTRLGRWAQRIYLWMWFAFLRPSMVYVSHPVLAAVLPRRSQRAALVYDCMDDAEAMADPADRADVREQEEKLVALATLVVASSKRLVELIETRHRRTPLLVRNGLSSAFLALAGLPEPSQANRARPLALYVGTVARWLDWEGLEKLAEVADIRMVGPVPANVGSPRWVACTGPVEHSALPPMLRDADVLLLPFARNEVTAAVDPVKLYEYVAARRPIVARYFPDLEHFRPFVTFYEESAQLCAAVARALGAPLAPFGDAVEFLEQQTWPRRWRAIETVLTAIEMP